MQRIRDDSARVQAQKAEAWTRFDTRQLSHITNYAFEHLRSGTTEPFDLGKCRQQLAIPDTAEASVSEFLGHCLRTDLEGRFDITAAVLASTILRRHLCAEDRGECHS